MPRATTCLLNNSKIKIGEALHLRDQVKSKRKHRPHFMCIECREAVKPHRGSDYAAAHFEHFKRNIKCSLSDPFRT
jgi:hypothetical protein